MGWQDWVVLAIGIIVAAALTKRVLCLLKGRAKGGCSSCGDEGCPLHKLKKK